MYFYTYQTALWSTSMLYLIFMSYVLFVNEGLLACSEIFYFILGVWVDFQFQFEYWRTVPFVMILLITYCDITRILPHFKPNHNFLIPDLKFWLVKRVTNVTISLDIESCALPQRIVAHVTCWIYRQKLAKIVQQPSYGW